MKWFEVGGSNMKVVLEELPIRSLLYLPAHDARKLKRAQTSGADAICLDLEDAVADADKVAARRAVADAVQTLASLGFRVLVRPNPGPGGVVAEDLRAAVVPGLWGVAVTKAGNAATVARVDDAVAEAEAAAGLPVGRLRTFLSIDSARMALSMREVAEHTSRLYCFGVGGSDFAHDLGVAVSDGMRESLWARSYAVVVSRACGIAPPLHPPNFEPRNLDQLRVIMAAARQLGFQGGVAIHPDQVDVLNGVFSPTAAECDWARRLLAEADDAAGATAIGGWLVERGDVRQARLLLQRAAGYGIEATGRNESSHE